MRCPECNRSQKYKEGMRCKSCGYTYVFNPKHDRIRDNILRTIIDKVSDKNQYAFTRNQLAVEICRYWRRSSRRWGCIVFIGLLLALLVGRITMDISIFWMVAIVVSIIGLSIVFAVLDKTSMTKSTSFADALKVIQRYDKNHPIKLLATGNAFAGVEHTVEDDFHYAPDRILVVERNDLVDMLIRNRFHQDTKTAVVSQDGYPGYVFAACKSFLAKNPQLPVLVAHDASPLGYKRIEQLRSSGDWSFTYRNLTDIGLSKEQIQAYSAEMPWQDARNQRLRFTDKHMKMLADGAAMRLDFFPPKILVGVVTSAMLSGLIALPLIANQGTIASDDYG